MSPPIQRRGLKYHQAKNRTPKVLVASHTEAWIEIANTLASKRSILSRLPYRGVDWNPFLAVISVILYCRLPYRGVDWNLLYFVTVIEPNSRLPYRGVDWNLLYFVTVIEPNSRLPYGGVDWNYKLHIFFFLSYQSPPIRRRGLKYQRRTLVSMDSMCVASHTEVRIGFSLTCLLFYNYIVAAYKKACTCQWKIA